ncbi:leucokinins-like [Uranotaenia lowii]|uniref:leucokinins-like n=1 Tax=Uranotaenia lowii TaxID=190385 RepID=UPI002478BC03|nr:leucokinins-like [Uranotaenia lowii]
MVLRVFQIALTILTLSMGPISGLELEESDAKLVKIINGCEWISRQNVISEILLDRYRKYVMDNFFLLDDVCAVHEWNKNSRGASELTEDSDAENSGNNQEQLLPSDNEIPPPDHASCNKSARNLFFCLSDHLGDPTLNAMILDNLEVICDPRYSRMAEGGIDKRDPKYVSKQKFFSWGGKRNTATVFYPWGGKRSVGRVHRQPKVVIRNPFHAWGGKRDQSPNQVGY